MTFSENFLQNILQKTDLVELVGSFVNLQQKGNRFWGCCPFHQDSSPSFTVNPQLNIFYCFGCHEKGNAFQFLMKVQNLNFPAAVEMLAQKHGLNLPDHKQTSQEKHKNACLELFRRLGTTFHHLLIERPEGKKARIFLQNRGISDQMIKIFELGYALTDRLWLKKFLSKKNYSENFLRTTGLFSTHYPDLFLFSGRLIFPIRIHTKEIVGFGGRALEDGQTPKYLNSSETDFFQKRHILYGFDQALPSIRTKQEVLLCEGYLDVISLHQMGIAWAIAPLGTAFTQEQAIFLKRYCQYVTCFFDNDDAGHHATAKVIEICEPLGISTKVVLLKDLKDPAELLEKGEQQALQNLLSSAQKGFDFLLDFYYIKANHNSTLNTNEFLRRVFHFLHKLPSGVQKESSLKRVADFLSVSKEALQEDFTRQTFYKTHQALQKTSKEFGLLNKESSGRSLEWSILMAVLAKPNLFCVLRRELCQEDFHEPRSFCLFGILEETILQEGNEEKTVFDILAKKIKNDSWNEQILSAVMSGEFDVEPDRMVADGIRRMKKRNLELQNRNLSQKLAKENLTQKEIFRLFQEKEFLNKTINHLNKE